MTVEASSPQRDALLEATRRILRRDGEAALTVRNVAAEAGCSTTGVYTWFGGKSGLVEAIFVEGFQSFDDALEPSYALGDLRESCRAFRRWALENRTHYLVMFGRAVPDFEPSDDAKARAYTSFLHLTRAIHAQRPELSEAGALDQAFHVNATVHGYVMIELVGLSPAPGEELDRLFQAGVDRTVAEVLGRA